MSGGNGKHGKDPEQEREVRAPDDEGGSLSMDPELEAAMREAMESIPDGTRRREEKPEAEAEAGQQAGPQDEELVLANPIEGDPVAEVRRLQQELADKNDRWMRLQADFDNFRRRASRDRQDALQYGPQILVKDLLSVVDNLDRAIDHARQSAGGDLQGLLQGVELVRRELLGVLEKHHVSEIEAQGKPFDPAFHEAMAQLADESVAPNTVLEVLQKGYQLRDRLLRPAQVVVSKGPEAADEGQGKAAG